MNPWPDRAARNLEKRKISGCEQATVMGKLTKTDVAGQKGARSFSDCMSG